MLIYNLYPLLAGPVKDWHPHLARAKKMGFEWVYINPIQVPGRSGSIYSIADYFHINPLFFDSNDSRPGEEQFRSMAAYANELGLALMADLVVNHCATDSPLTIHHPEWFMHNPDGSFVHPTIFDNGDEIVWTDVVKFAHTEHAYAAGFYSFIITITGHLFSLGFNGFRCDMADHIPSSFWGQFIGDIKRKHPDCVFLAETLACTITQVRQTASAGFDLIYNSAKWWDYESAWLLQQHDLLLDFATVSFPESHDTERLYTDSKWAINSVKQRCVFTAFFSMAWLIPIGFEFGFTKRLCVDTTRPADWEPANIDIQEFISQTIAMKKRYPVLNEECPMRMLQSFNPNILVLWKATINATEEALLVLNKDIRNHQSFSVSTLARYLLFAKDLEDVSPGCSHGVVPMEHFTRDLKPGQALVLVGGNPQQPR